MRTNYFLAIVVLLDADETYAEGWGSTVIRKLTASLLVAEYNQLAKLVFQEV